MNKNSKNWLRAKRKRFSKILYLANFEQKILNKEIKYSLIETKEKLQMLFLLFI